MPLSKSPQKQLYVPAKIDIPLILTSLGYGARYIYDHQDKYNYILHKITEIKSFNGSNGPDGYSNLHRDTLRSVLGMPYADNALKELLAQGIIECDKQRLVGKKSFGYRIHADFASPLVSRFIFKETFEQKLLLRAAAYKKAKRKQYARTWKNLTELGIKQCEALAYIGSKYDLGDAEQLSKHNADESSINKIANQDYYLEQPDPASRIYTNLCNLRGDLRQFLTYKKCSAARLVNLDIANSQPYLFGLLLREYYRGRELPDDVQHYIQLTATGSFYNHMMQVMQLPGDADAKLFKKDFFGKTYYCSTHYSRRTREGQAFRQQFPRVADLVDYYKEGGHAQLAIRMQRTEAQIMLHDIGQQLHEQNMWYTTIHDSVVCLEEHAEAVKAMMLAAFSKAIGVPPTVRTEPL